MSTQTVIPRRYFNKAWLMEQKSLIALLVLIAIVSTMSPNFFTINNLFNILQQTSVNAIMAVGMTLVILTSGIDLSVGSLLALTGAVAASDSQRGGLSWMAPMMTRCTAPIRARARIRPTARPSV